MKNVLVLAVVDLRNPYRAGERNAGLMQPVRCFRPARGVGFERVGVENVVANIPPRSAMILVRAAAQADAHDAAAGPAIFGVVQIGLDLDLSHGLRRRNDGYVGRRRGLSLRIGRSVQQHLISVGGAAISSNAVLAVVEGTQAECALRAPRNACCHLGEIEYVAAACRYRLHEFLVEHGALTRGLSLEQRHLGAHVYSLGGSAEGEREVHCDAVGDAKLDLGLDHGLESVCGNSD